jgi:hypothetical protein
VAGRRIVLEEEAQLGRRVLVERHVEVEEGARCVLLPRRAARAVVRVAERSFSQGSAVVDERVDVDHLLDAEALAPGAHPCRVVERERPGGPRRRLCAPGVEDPEPVPDVGDGGHRRPRPAVESLLVDDDDRREVLDAVGVGPSHRGQVVLGVRAERGVDLTLRLGGDGVEHEGGLPRTGHPHRHDEGPLGQVEVEASEVVLSDAAQADRVELVVLHFSMPSDEGSGAGGGGEASRTTPPGSCVRPAARRPR